MIWLFIAADRFEIADLLRGTGWTRAYDTASQTDYAFNGVQWMSYDDPSGPALAAKVPCSAVQCSALLAKSTHTSIIRWFHYSKIIITIRVTGIIIRIRVTHINVI